MSSRLLVLKLQGIKWRQAAVISQLKTIAEAAKVLLFFDGLAPVNLCSADVADNIGVHVCQIALHGNPDLLDVVLSLVWSSTSILTHKHKSLPKGSSKAWGNHRSLAASSWRASLTALATLPVPDQPLLRVLSEFP